MTGRVRGWCPSLFEPMASGDGLLARVKPPLGRLSAEAARALAVAARRFGNGQLELTNRAALQVRGLSEASLSSFQQAVLAAGLAHADPAVERRRNVVVSPLASAAGVALAGELEAWIAEDPTLAALPSKFGFAVGDGLPGDVRLSVAGAPTPPPSGFASHLPRVAMEDLGVRCSTATRGSCREATEGAFWRIELGGGLAGITTTPLATVQTVIRNLLQLPEHPRRLAELVRSNGGEALFAGAGIVPTAAAHPSTAQPVAGPIGEAFALGLPFGAFTAEDLGLAVDLAERFADGVLRTSPWRALVLIGVSDEAQLTAAAAGFVVDQQDPRLSVVACTGAPGCASAHAPTRADAAFVAAQRLPGLVHLSGCAKGCAHPAPAAFTLVAAPDGYGLVRAGRAGDLPERRGLTLSEAARLLSEIP